MYPKTEKKFMDEQFMEVPMQIKGTYIGEKLKIS